MPRKKTPPPPAPDPEPWERQPTETEPAYEAFVAYRDAGQDRSIRRVARQLDKSSTLIGKWSSEHSWPARVAAWDAELDRQNRAAQVEAVREMAKRHADTAVVFQKKVVQSLAQLDPSALAPADQIRWFVEAVKIERLARGEPTDNQSIAAQVQGELSVRSSSLVGVVLDPAAADLANQLLERLGGRTVEPARLALGEPEREVG